MAALKVNGPELRGLRGLRGLRLVTKTPLENSMKIP
jgi:hypothetical protein